MYVCIYVKVQVCKCRYVYVEGIDYGSLNFIPTFDIELFKVIAYLS